MSVECNFHFDSRTPRIEASSYRTMGAPLRIKIGDEGSVVIFIGDQAYTDALIKAINGVPAPVREQVEEETP